MHRISCRLIQRVARRARRRRECFAHTRGAGELDRTVVLGLGRRVHGDEAVGLAVADELRRLLEADPIRGVEVRESTPGGPELIDLLVGFSRAVLVDCVDADQARPGSLRRLDGRRCAPGSRPAGSHAGELAAALDRAEALGLPMPAPIEILGIEPRDTLSCRDTLSPEVAAVVPGVARALHAWLHAPSADLNLPSA